MLTVRFERLGVVAGERPRLLDLGCGRGRHAFAAAGQGAFVVAVDRDGAECKEVAAGMSGLPGVAVNGDALTLPFADSSFDTVIAAEVLEHIPDDRAAVAELVRVLRPGGRLAVTVPRWFSERVCWALADDYHAPAVAGGHVRIYRRRELRLRLRAAGLGVVGSHHAHALHSPYWWLKCLVGVKNEASPPVRLYHRFLVWDILRPHRWVRMVEAALNPVIGKSLVIYADKPC